ARPRTPETHWPRADSTFEADYKAALAETDDTKRKVITDKMQKELYDTGGLIIPFFQNLLDAYNGPVQGLVERANTLNLDHYGRGWKNLYFSEQYEIRMSNNGGVVKCMSRGLLL